MYRSATGCVCVPHREMGRPRPQVGCYVTVLFIKKGFYKKYRGKFRRQFPSLSFPFK